MILRTLSATLLLAGCVVTTPPDHKPPQPVPQQKPFRNLDDAVRVGVVDREVVRTLTGIVVLEDRGETQLARGTNDAFSAEEAGDAVFNEARPAVLERIYDAQKARIFGDPQQRFEILRSYDFMPVAFVRFRSARDLLDMINDAGVAGVAADGQSPLTLVQSLPLVNQPVVAGWGETGAGTTIAVLDSGVNFLLNAGTTALYGGCTAPGIPAGCRVLADVDFAPADGSLDDNGHGTAVASIAASVAPASTFVSLDVSNPVGIVNDNAAIGALDWAIQNRTRFNIRVANLSFGSGHANGPCDEILNPFGRPLANTRIAGILPVAGSGNSATPGGGAFRNGIARPACNIASVPVGAVLDANIGSFSSPPPDTCTDMTTTARQIPCWSQTAPILKLLAPGAAVVSSGGAMAGTSMSAPFVSAAAAIILASNPSRSFSEIQSAMETSGPAITDTRNMTTQRVLDIGLSQCVFNRLSNDNFASAQVLGGVGAITYRNWCSSRETAEPNHAGVAGSGSVWFRWTAPFIGEVIFSTAGSNHDTLLAVYRGTGLNALTAVASSDDRSPLTTSEVRFPVTIGQQFAIAVDAKVTAAGTSGGVVKLSWNIPDPNDTFSAAVQLNAAMFHQVDGMNIGATKQPGEPNHCSDPGGASVWYSWTSYARGRAVAEITTGLRKCVAVYTGPGLGALTSVGTYPFRDIDDTVWFDATPNTTYFIAVDGLLSESAFPTPNQSAFRLRVGLRKQIVFTSLRDGNYEIFSMEPDGSSPRRLTIDSASDREPASNFFDSQIAFTSDRDGNNEIYLMNADGSNVRRITNNAANDRSPVFLTDGMAILFVSDRDGNPELYMVGLGGLYGTAEQRLTTYQYDDLDPSIVMLPSRISTIAHSRFRVLDPQSGAGDYDLRVQNESGTEIWTGTSAEDRQPSWSGDGQNLVFTAVDTQGFQTLWIWDRINRARSLGSAEASSGSWSPWQDEIVFATTRTGNGEIFKMKADGSAATNLSNNAAWDGEPHWQ